MPKSKVHSNKQCFVGNFRTRKQMEHTTSGFLNSIYSPPSLCLFH